MRRSFVNRSVMRADPERLIQKILAEYPQVEFALLFGSLATGIANVESDIDLAILAHRPIDKSLKISLIESIAKETGRSVDLIDLQFAGQPLLGEILSKGKILLENDEHYARLILKNLLDKADFLPYRNRILKQRREAWIGK